MICRYVLCGVKLKAHPSFCWLLGFYRVLMLAASVTIEAQMQKTGLAGRCRMAFEARQHTRMLDKAVGPLREE